MKDRQTAMINKQILQILMKTENIDLHIVTNIISINIMCQSKKINEQGRI